MQFKKYLWVVLLAALILTGCSSGVSTQDAGPAIEAYLEALVAKDPVEAVTLSCLAWEESARAEALSLEAVEVQLQDLACQATGEQGDYTVVDCEGVLIANYGGEDQTIELGDRSYLAVVEDGVWKMCGYSGE
ncbi:MAG: hypothetical protein PVF49_13255 [Anaerolineales bacterium]|jgi:hypothetical protein